ncbi:lipoprotein-releasing ABC transporter permease subunit [Alteromonas sp. KUL106]|uniref:lipoprotein-releasing ABC transporter permease subunit n=1 Tax=Alteromonas sp. KUL106 TaxID=2480799 RepID=UPI0012E44AB4|nr:lipoprotein-releasing ABC transporter permease subunit [Alteromonas sp. KUL106]GFD69650.1 lipoprotein transporter subunit LolE [Alteromonas sp. KUL106]GFD77141.1 lipoprotein transporter subunit LolE [Tenacibaculum sp. KUL118]
MLAFELAKKFRKTRSQQRFISFISMSSTIGIGLGCFVLIVLLSVMNGFEKELTDRILSVVPHGEIYSKSESGIENLDAQLYRFSQDSRLASVTPYTGLTGMLQSNGELKAISVTGIPVEQVGEKYAERVTKQDWQRFSRQSNSLIVGKGILREMGLAIGDKVQILIPQTTQDLSFKAPRSIPLEIAGVLSVGGELDYQLGLMHIETASEAIGITSKAQGLQFTLNDPFSAYNTMRDIGYNYPQAVYMSDWTRTQGHLYDDIQLVRAVVYIALSLVIAVACFNIVSSLVMEVRDKQASIAILKTMGASDSLIRNTFVLQGVINGIVGISVGVALALLVAPNISDIVRVIESGLGVEILSGDIYFIDFLPSSLHWQDVVVTVIVAMVLSVGATLYPAQKAVNISPSSALH